MIANAKEKDMFISRTSDTKKSVRIRLSIVANAVADAEST